MTNLASLKVAPAAPDLPDGVVTTHWYGPSDSRRDAFALRHRGYVHAGLIPPSPFGIYSDPYDELPTTVVAALWRREAPIATLRLSFFDPGTIGPALPCEKVYPEMAGFKAAADGRVVELSRLAIDPEITNTRYRARVYAAAVRTGLSAALAMNAKQLLVATQTKWRPFYEHVMGFKAMGPAQLYPPGDVPVVLLSRRLDASLLKRSRNMFFSIDAGEIEALRGQLPALTGLTIPA